jgi:hypothetical protein
LLDTGLLLFASFGVVMIRESPPPWPIGWMLFGAGCSVAAILLLSLLF